MKKVLLVLSTLFLISCVNLNETKLPKATNNKKSSVTKNNVVNVQKDNKKKETVTNDVKTTKTKNLLKEAFAQILSKDVEICIVFDDDIIKRNVEEEDANIKKQMQDLLGDVNVEIIND